MKNAVVVPIVLTLALIIILPVLFASNSYAINGNSENYLNMRFWDPETGSCFCHQNTANSCVSASVQMVLKYFDYMPLPNQTELATEMHTDINHTTYWQYVCIPFKNRGYLEYVNESLSQDFNEALSCLKGNLTRNFAIIVDTWYDESAKSNGTVTHVRVVTGYNSTGIFFNDPWSGPNEFLNYSEFSNLWKTGLGYWAFIVKSEPKFNVTVKVRDAFGNPIPGVSIVLKEANLTKITDSNGTAQFLNLPIANYTVSYDWRLQSETRNIALTYSKEITFQPFFSDLEIVLILAVATVLTLMVALFRRRSRRARQVPMPNDTRSPRDSNQTASSPSARSCFR